MNKSYMALPFDVLDDAEDLTDEELGSLIRYMARYAETGEESGELAGAARYFRRRVIGTVDRFTDAANRKSESARKAAEARWSNANACDGMRNDANACDGMRNDANACGCMPTQCDGMRNDATNTKTKTETETETEAEAEIKEIARASDVPSICQSVCNEFNRLTGGNYRAEAPYISNLIINLLSAGYTEDDMLTVIRKMYDEWKDNSEMRGNVKPTTLLGNKFGEYLDRPVAKKGKRKSRQREKMEELMRLNMEVAVNDTG